MENGASKSDRGDDFLFPVILEIFQQKLRKQSENLLEQ